MVTRVAGVPHWVHHRVRARVQAHLHGAGPRLQPGAPRGLRHRAGAALREGARGEVREQEGATCNVTQRVQLSRVTCPGDQVCQDPLGDVSRRARGALQGRAHQDRGAQERQGDNWR